jgi:DNA-binding SARP family transcriptional activator
MTWRIELFGSLRATRGDWVVSRFRTEKAALLLATLAYEPGRAHAREALAESLWPEGGPAAGRNNLCRELSSLRAQLEPPGVTPGSVIIADRVVVKLDSGAATADVAEFRVAIEGAARASGEERIRLLGTATGLYRGELLHGHYHEWVIENRERLKGSFVRAARTLAAELRA